MDVLTHRNKQRGLLLDSAGPEISKHKARASCPVSYTSTHAHGLIISSEFESQALDLVAPGS